MITITVIRDSEKQVTLKRNSDREYNQRRSDFFWCGSLKCGQQLMYCWNMISQIIFILS